MTNCTFVHRATSYADQNAVFHPHLSADLTIDRPRSKSIGEVCRSKMLKWYFSSQAPIKSLTRVKNRILVCVGRSPMWPIRGWLGVIRFSLRAPCQVLSYLSVDFLERAAANHRFDTDTHFAAGLVCAPRIDSTSDYYGSSTRYKCRNTYAFADRFACEKSHTHSFDVKFVRWKKYVR